MRVTMYTLVGLLTMGLVVSGCDVVEPAVDDSASTELGIKGGYADYTDTAVFGLVMFGNGGMGSCTGTLISPNVVLTAQHCIAPTLGTEGGGVACGVTYFGNAYSAQSLYVSASQQLTQNPNDYHNVWEVVLPPANSDFCGNDVALLVLGKPIPEGVAVPMIPRVDSQLQVGEGYSAIGYGAVNQQGQGSGMRRRRDNLDVECVPPGCGGYWIEDSEWVGDTGVCQGDSGGPAIDEQNRVIGVASRGASGCQFPIYGGVAPWGEWIKETTVYAANTAGITPPPWATGWPTDPKYSYPVGSSCGANDQCKSGVCHDNYCTRQCNENSPCPSPYSCDSVSGFCLLPDVGEACSGDMDCNSGICKNGWCTRACDTTTANCPSGFECNPDSKLCDLPSVGDACEAADDCATGHCLGGECTRKCDDLYGCPDNYYCNEAGLCAPFPMGDVCANPDECLSGLCEDGFCTRACADDSQCVDGFLCDGSSGMCMPIPVGDQCLANSDCDGGLCENGICTRVCSEDLGCPSGFSCGDTGLCEKKKTRSSGLYPGCSSGESPLSSGLVLVLSFAMLAVLGRRRESMPRAE
jgi:hypothetical protein